MTCEQLVDRLVEYVEGDLDPQHALQVESHARECPDCDHFVKTYQATIAVAERALTQAMPAEVRQSLEQRLRRAITGA